MLIIGGIGLAINLGAVWALMRGDRDNLTIRGALLYMVADTLGSAGTVVAAVVIMAGYLWADAAVSLLTGAVVLSTAVGLLKDSGGVLLKMTPKGVDTDEVTTALRMLSGVADAHDLHIWSLDGQYTLLTAHIVVVNGQSSEPVRVAAETMPTERFGIADHTLQLEGDVPCATPDCCAAL